MPPTTPPQTTLDQPSISIDTDRNLDPDLRQTGSRSIDQSRSDPDSENRRSSRSPQGRPSFRSATPLQGRQADTLNVTLNKSCLWDYIIIIHLLQNMRVGNDGQFQQWLLQWHRRSPQRYRRDGNTNSN